MILKLIVHVCQMQEVGIDHAQYDEIEEALKRIELIEYLLMGVEK